VAGIELVVIFTMAAFNLSIMAGSVWLDKLVVYTELGSGSLEQRKLFL